MNPSLGLCDVCRHAKRIRNRRGSEFLLCQRAERDSAFSRYPPLPVRRCPGFEPRPEADSDPT